MSKILTDHFIAKDGLAKSSHSPTLWARTQVIIGHGLRKNKLGISSLDEVIFETENMVPIGGVQYAMEQIFGVKYSGSIQIPTLNDTMKIGSQDYHEKPTGTLPYVYGHKVCLFGIGTGGAAENNLTALEVKYNETNVSTMIPFRYVESKLEDVDADKYFGMKDDNGKYAYYLKKFDSDPVIHHVYKNGEDGEDGTEVDGSYLSTDPTIGVQTFTECTLTISRKDVREWFAANGNVETPRVNSIGLFDAVYDEVAKDYAVIQLFSKLNIPTEPLYLTKDMNIIYRVYGT